VTAEIHEMNTHTSVDSEEQSKTAETTGRSLDSTKSVVEETADGAKRTQHATDELMWKNPILRARGVLV
jgi:methyl-accepting chemotaxis protein